MKFSMTGEEEIPFKIGDSWIEMTAWAGLKMQCSAQPLYNEANWGIESSCITFILPRIILIDIVIVV